MIEKAKNICNQSTNIMETAGTDYLACDFTKETFDQIEPRRRSGDEVKVESGMALES